jgi:hypothetical protein
VSKLEGVNDSIKAINEALVNENEALIRDHNEEVVVETEESYLSSLDPSKFNMIDVFDCKNTKEVVKLCTPHKEVSFKVKNFKAFKIAILKK